VFFDVYSFPLKPLEKQAETQPQAKYESSFLYIQNTIFNNQLGVLVHFKRGNHAQATWQFMYIQF